MQSAGLIYGFEPHHLDHLAPLCSLEKIPLILTETTLAEQAEKFYPSLQILTSHPDEIVKNFDTLICSIPRVLFEEIFFFAQNFQNKRIKTIWCPHGNSDKGRNIPFMEALKDEELLLTYGPRMEAFLQEKGVHVPTKRVGNYRFEYFQKHRDFYEALAPKSTYFYAPTWNDAEHNSSFPKVWKELKNLPGLLVKLHPNLYIQYPEEIAKLKEEGVNLVEDFPPIYPLLAKTELLIGDLSSICYDFLAFEKPIVLLKDSPLSKIGRFVEEKEYPNLLEICKEELHKKPNTRELYEETFSKKHQWQAR